MKKVFLTALVAVLGLSSSAYAQVSQGTLTVGGAFSLTTEKSKYDFGNTTVEDDPTTYFELSPSLGYLIADDLELGVQIGFSREAQSDGDESAKTTLFTFGPYARKYFSVGETVSLYGQAGLEVGAGKTKYEDDNVSIENDKISSFSIGLTPGVLFRPAERIGVELSAGFLGYNTVTIEDPDFGGDAEEIKSSDFGLTLDLRAVQLGVKLFF